MPAGDRLAATETDDTAAALLRFLFQKRGLIQAFRQSFSRAGEPLDQFTVHGFAGTSLV
jgi:hypothetical protein